MTLEVSKGNSNNKRKQFYDEARASPFSNQFKYLCSIIIMDKKGRFESRMKRNHSNFNEPATGHPRALLDAHSAAALVVSSDENRRKKQPREVLKINRNFSLAFYMRSHYATTEESRSRRGEKTASTIIEAYEQSLQCLLKSCTKSDAMRWKEKSLHGMRRSVEG
jgi:hypothetical protein